MIGSGSILKVLVTFQQDKARKPIQLQQKHQYQSEMTEIEMMEMIEMTEIEMIEMIPRSR